MTDLDISYDESGLPSGRLPKDIFAVGVQYPDTETGRKKRTYWMFRRRSNANDQGKACAKYIGEPTLHVGHITWEEVVASIDEDQDGSQAHVA
jgi:hypothetical protein